MKQPVIKKKILEILEHLTIYTKQDDEFFNMADRNRKEVMLGVIEHLVKQVNKLK
jgi:hypothetical protein